MNKGINRNFSKAFKMELKQVQNEYIKALTTNKLNEQIEIECKNRVLQQHEFYIAEEFKERREEERILDYTEDFLMTDADFEKYCKLVYNEEIKAGLDIPNWETTATYKSFDELKKAEKALFNVGINTVPNSIKAEITKAFEHWKHRDKVLDLMSRVDL